jgi:hypothetical protein
MYIKQSFVAMHRFFVIGGKHRKNGTRPVVLSKQPLLYSLHILDHHLLCAGIGLNHIDVYSHYL